MMDLETQIVVMRKHIADLEAARDSAEHQADAALRLGAEDRTARCVLEARVEELERKLARPEVLHSQGAPAMTATLSEIIEMAKSGQKPSSEDLLYAVLALDTMAAFDHRALMDLAEAEAGREHKNPVLTRSAVWQLEETFRRNKCALGKPPREWIGWSNDPANPEFLKRRAAALRLFERVAAKGANK